jgi:phosphoserine phosphatase
MLCSKCGNLIRPVVVLDIDGTLGAYHSHFHYFAQAYIGERLPTGYDGSCELHEWYDMSLSLYRDIKLAYRQGGMKRSMPMLHGARNLVVAVQGTGAEVWICTTRPYLRLDNIDPDTREWLGRNRITYDGLLYSENKYQRLLEIVDKERIVAVLDDLPEMCQAAYRNIGEEVPILAMAQHNAYYRLMDKMRTAELVIEVKSFDMAADLPAAERMIMFRIGMWKEAHA